jgi:L-threonylcarbamoyladenylate synthase
VTVMDCRDPEHWGPAIDEAVHALSRGDLVVLPTDTVYGVAADAFNPRAVAALGPVKGRPDDVPPPVMVAEPRTVDGLCADVPDGARALIEAFWPGPLTLLLRAQPSLAWEVSEPGGPVAVRMPDHPAALAVLRRTGPLAVTGANRHGRTAPESAEDAVEALGEGVRVYLDAGTLRGGALSTVVDATTDRLVLLRAGAVGLAELRAVTAVLDPDEEPAPDVADEPAGEDDR